MVTKLTDLRDGIDGIVSQLRRERADGEVPIDDAIRTVRTELEDSIVFLNDQLVDLTLRKLIHDVGGRKRLGSGLAGDAGLFGRYTGVPAMITTVRGRKRDTTKATFEEADNWLRVRERDDTELRDKHEKFRLMVDELRPYKQLPNDTLEDAARRKFQPDTIQA